MKQLVSLSILFELFVSLSLFSTASSLVYPSFNGFQALEFASNSSDIFKLEAQTWTASRALTTNITTVCGNTLLLGGYGILSYEGFFEKSYSGLTVHKSILYEIQFLIIDNWSPTDSIILQFDNVNQTVSWDISQIVARTLTASNLCGQPNANDLQYLTLMGGVAHTASTLRFRIISKVNQSPLQASFGVRNISLIVSPKDPSPMCYRSGDNIATGAVGECPCPITTWTKNLSPVSCKPCDVSCLDCFESHNNECFQCRPGYFFTSTNKCEKCAPNCATCSGPGPDKCMTCTPGNWLQPNGNCVPTCPLPGLYSQQVGDFKVCQTGCSTGQYAYWNQTCGSSCPAPYVSQTIPNYLLCKLCSNDAYYFYQWNNTCGASCPSPFVINGQFCQLPCDINAFYYPNNNTGGSVCNSPFVSSVVSGVLKQCKNPCDGNGYLLWNGTCGASCLAPHYGQNIDNILKCGLCMNNNDFYYASNNTCGSTCLSPFVTNGQFCQLPCNSGEYYYPNNQSCGSTCGNQFVSSMIFGAIKQCQSPCASNEYLSWDGTCQSSCPAPHYGQNIQNNLFCKLCQNTGDFYFDWNNTCGSSCPDPWTKNGSFCHLPCNINDFYFPNNKTCASTCLSPFLSSVIYGVIKQCKTPCAANEYLLWDGTCGSSCPAPHYGLNSSNNLVCKLCQNNNHYYFDWKNSCGPTCDPPFVANGQFCQLPCAANDFYFPNNNTCNSDCDSSFLAVTVYGGLKQCESPCAANEYLLWNRTCSSSCLAPHYGQNVNSNLFCRICQNSADFYYEWNNTCGSGCQHPFITNVDQTCELPCDINDYYYPNNGTCGSTCSNQFTSSVVYGVVKQCESPCDANEYLLWDGTCSNSCPAPHYGQNVQNNLFCKLCENQGDFYYDWNNSCRPTCLSPLIADGKLCQLPCGANDFYFSSNNTCNSACNSPFATSLTFHVVKECRNPCDPSEFLLWDGTCSSSCLAPSYQRISSDNAGLTFCDACQPGYFMFPNGTCLSQCDSPLQQETINSSSFCRFPCSGANNIILQNGACINSCHFPMNLRTESIGQFCDHPCQAGDYFYVKNSSCIPECNSPWKSDLINGVHICSAPCVDGAFLDEASSSCLSDCNSPSVTMTKNSILTCIVKSLETETNSGRLTEDSVLSMNQATNTTGKLTSVGTVVASLLSSSSPSGVTLTVLVKMLKYIRYIDVKYPRLLELMLEDQAESPISMNIGFGMPKGLEKEFERKPLPDKFDKYHVPSNFIVNCWQELLTTGVVVSVMVSAGLTAHFTKKKHKQVSSLFKKVSKATRWNFFLLIFSSNLVEIGLFSCLQMRSISFASFGEILSWVLSLFMSSFSLFVLIQAFYIPFDLRRQRKIIGKESVKKWEDWSILYKEFKSQKFSQQSYMFFFLLRTIIFDVLLGCLTSYPLVQAALLSTMSLGLLCFLVICRPFKEKFYLVKSLVEECTLAFVNICVLIFAIMDCEDSENEHARAKVGDMVVLVNFAFNMIALIFAVIEISIRIFGIYQLVKLEKSRGVKFWKKVFMIIVEPEGMEISQKTQIKKSGSMRKVHPYQSASHSSISSILSSTRMVQKSSQDLTGLSENLDFNGSIADNISTNRGNRSQLKNLLLHSNLPSYNSDDIETKNGEVKESTPPSQEDNLKLIFRSNTLLRIHARRTWVNRSHHSLKTDLKDIILK